MEMSTYRRWLVLVVLILAGEMIFALPFQVARFFRPTVLDVFSLSNTDLGVVFVPYGIMAMICYFPGGTIADRFSPRVLITVSLLITAAGGFYMAQIPGRLGLAWLFGYWGVSTILLFWSGLIRATREWGGSLSQGRAFGVLDGGRGFVAALFSTIVVVFLAQSLGSDLDELGVEEKTRVMQGIIYYYIVCTALVALLVWLFLPKQQAANSERSELSFQAVSQVVKRPSVWLQGIVIICAYSGYKALDNYGLYVQEVLGMSESRANEFASLSAYLRPVAAIGAGILADRVKPSRVIFWGFGILVVSSAVLSVLDMQSAGSTLLFANLIFTLIAVYGIRGVYFALIEQSQTPAAVTGTTAGLISVVGFTPDFFFNPLAGAILDTWPGVQGFQYFFMLVTGIATVGLIAVFALAKRVNANISRESHKTLPTRPTEPVPSLDD